MNVKTQSLEVIKRLKKEYPDAKIALNFRDPFELLVATILSAQTTDIHVNKVTEGLFRKYKSITDYAGAAPDVLQKDLSSINFYRNKAKNIQAAARIIIDKFHSKVPKSMTELVKSAGGGTQDGQYSAFYCLWHK